MTPHGIILLKSFSQGGPLNSKSFFAHGQVFADDSFDRQFLPCMLFLSSLRARFDWLFEILRGKNRSQTIVWIIVIQASPKCLFEKGPGPFLESRGKNGEFMNRSGKKITKTGKIFQWPDNPYKMFAHNVEKSLALWGVTWRGRFKLFDGSARNKNREFSPLSLDRGKLSLSLSVRFWTCVFLLLNRAHYPPRSIEDRF